MPTYTPDGIAIEPVQVTVKPIPMAPEEDLPEVTVMGKFDWQFWLGLVAAAFAGYTVLKSLGYVKKLPTRRRTSRRMR